MGPQTSMGNVRSVYSSQCSWQPYVQYNNEATHILPSIDNPQRSNCGTFLQPRVQMLASNKPNQWARQPSVQSDNQLKDQSDAYMNPHLNLWKPVQGQPRVAEESSSHNCYGLNCKLCRSAEFCMESRKRKFDFMESSNDGTLMDVLTSFLNPSVGDWKPQELPVSPSRQCLPGELPPLEQWSNTSVLSEEVSEVKSKPLTMASGSEVSSKVTENAMCNNQISQGYDWNSGAKNNESKEPHVFCVKEKLSYGKEELSQVGPEVNCELNTFSYDCESELESMQGITPSVNLGDCDVALESEKTDTKITSCHADGSGSGNINKTSASLADSFTASQIIEHLSSCIQHNKV